MHTVRAMNGIAYIDGFSVYRHGGGLRRNGKCERLNFLFRYLHVGKIDHRLGVSFCRNVPVNFRSAVGDPYIVFAFGNKDHHLGLNDASVSEQI